MSMSGFDDAISVGALCSRIVAGLVPHSRVPISLQPMQLCQTASSAHALLVYLLVSHLVSSVWYNV